MKYRFALLILLLPLTGRGQSAGEEEAKMRALLTELTTCWALGVDSNNTTIDLATYNLYKSLFDTGAKVDDDLNFHLVLDRNGGHYTTFAVAKDFDVYAHDVALQLEVLGVGVVTEPRRLPVPGAPVYEITRTVYAGKPAKYLFQNADSFAATIMGNHPVIGFEKSGDRYVAVRRQQIAESLKEKWRMNGAALYLFTSTSTLQVTLSRTGDADMPYRIAEIRQVANKVSCMNDIDADGVPNSIDVQPETYGEYTAAGAPDVDLDGVADADDLCPATFGTAENHGCPLSYFANSWQLTGTFGLQANSAVIGLPELNQLGYHDANGRPAADVLQSRQGRLTSPKVAAGSYSEADMCRFFSKGARSLGVSLGVSYSLFSMTYQLTEPAVYTYKASDGYDDYRRQIRISSMSDKLDYRILNIPVQLNYRLKIGNLKSWEIRVKAGPSLTVLAASSNAKATVDAGGIYQIDTVSRNRFAYYDYLDPSSTWNVYLTAGGINSQSASPGAQAVYESMNSLGNYDFATQKPYSIQKTYSRIRWALNCSLEGQYRRRFNSPMALVISLHFLYAPSTGSSRRYIAVDKTSDPFNSVFNSNGTSYYLAFGSSLGLVYTF